LWRSTLVPWAAAALAGVAVGLGVAQPVLLAAGAVLLLGGGTLVAIVRRPELAPTLFWLAFSLQSTVFFGFSVTGLYYPIYLLMGANALLMLGRGRLEVHPRLLPYAAFLLLVLAGLLPIVPALTMTGYQRLFIYVIGFLVYFQFPKDRIPVMLVHAQVLATLAIAGWVILSSVQGGFGPRGSVGVDQNSVSELLGFGVIALMAQLMARALGPLRAVATWLAVGAGLYAMLLLASRGLGIAIAVVAVMMFARILLDARRSVPVAVVALLAGAALANLPGSDNLLVRFQSSDVATANDRLPLWQATLGGIAASTPTQVMLGHGFETSKALVQSVRAVLTSTHDAYLQILYEFGVLGLSAFLAIHLALLARFFRERSASALYGAGVVAYLLMADLTVTAPDGFLYWVAIGHLTALSVALDRVPARPALPAEGA